MNTRLFVTTAMIVLGSIWSPRTAAACGCGGTVSSPVAFRHADAVFVGQVLSATRPPSAMRTNIDGSVVVSVTPSGPTVVTFDLRRVFRGFVRGQATLEAGYTTCDFRFAPSEVWLIYAVEEHGLLGTHKCLRTRLVSDASEDLKYLEALLEGRPQAVVFGDVFEQTTTPDGAPAQGALFEELEVVAIGAGQRFGAKTDRWGPYQLVLPPGEFEVWAEREGRRVSPISTIRLSNGDERHLAVTAALR